MSGCLLLAGAITGWVLHVTGRRRCEVEIAQVVGGVPDGSSFRCQPGWGDPFGHPVGHLDDPAAPLELAVVIATEQAHVVDVGVSEIEPWQHVVGLGPRRRTIAAGERASA